MATSKAFATSNARVKYTITIKQNSQSVSGNYSNVTVSVRFYRTNTGYTTYGTGTVYCKINGTTYSADVTPTQKITSAGIVLFSKTLNINHNADGAKTLTCSAWIKHNAPLTSVEQSYSQKLTTIPRATKPEISPTTVEMGKSIAISLPRASAAFTHNITYQFGTKTGAIGSGVATSATFTLPLSLADEIPNAVSGYGSIICKTYNGSTYIGSSSVSFYAKVPVDVIPAIKTISISEAVSGIASKFGVYVQNKSKLNVSVAASGVYGSTIKSYKTTLDRHTYNGSSFTSAILESSGTIDVVTTVTDSRGRAVTARHSVNVTPYTAPKISKFYCQRCDSFGTPDDQGEYLKADIDFAISDILTKNDKLYKIEYKYENEALTTLVSGSVYAFKDAYIHPNAILNPDKSYLIKITVSDYFSSTSYTVKVPTTFALMDFHTSGKGIAFGKASETENIIEFAMPTKFSFGEIPQDAIVLKGTEDLNAIKTPGYYIFSVAASKTLVNCPVLNASGSIEIVREGEATQIRQVVTRCSETEREIWERVYYSDKWHLWTPVFKGGKRILWSGGYYMTAGHVITLSEPVSAQQNGIVLVFSAYGSGAVQNFHFNTFFVSKKVVEMLPGNGYSFFLVDNADFTSIAAKYLYIDNEKISGYKNNNLTGSGGGITFKNNEYVLRYVIGV